MAQTKYPLPAVVNPTDRIYVCVPVPNDAGHRQAFAGALWNLARWYSWQEDPAHNALAVAEVWKAIFRNVMRQLDARLDRCGEVPPISPSIGTSGGDENLIRQNPDNPCELQTSIDGTHWCTFADLSLCFSGMLGQPSGEQPQPEAGGGCQKYTMVFNANSFSIVPVIVNAGDTIEFSNVKGLGSEDSIIWRCPDGSYYFSGHCTGDTYLDAGDPAPALPHLSLIARIGTVYYPVDGIITVPGGIVNEQVVIQANIPSLSGLSGDYAVDANVCNNQSAEWSHILDLTTDRRGFVVVDAFSCTTGNFGLWDAGLGWEPGVCLNAGSNYQILQIRRTFPADVAFNTVSFRYDATKGSHFTDVNKTMYIEAIDSGGTVTHISDQPVLTGTGKTIVSSGPFTARGLGLWIETDVSADPDPPDGAARAYQLVVAGTGFDPFV